MRVSAQDFEKWVTPDGKEISVPAGGVASQSKELKIRYWVRLVGLVLLLVVMFIFPIAQFFIPRSGGLLGARADSSPVPVITATSTLEVVQFSAASGLASGVVISTSLPSPIPITPTLTPTPAQAVASVAACLVYAVPVTDSAVVGQLLEGSIVRPVGWWRDWLQVSEGWLPGSCLSGSIPDSVEHFEALPLVSPPVLPAPSVTPAPVVVSKSEGFFFPATPPATPTPKPDLFKFQPLPGGFNPGWCVKVRAVGVWTPAGDRFVPGADGYVYFGSEVLGLAVTIERANFYQPYTFSGCGQYD